MTEPEALDPEYHYEDTFESLIRESTRDDLKTPVPKPAQAQDFDGNPAEPDEKDDQHEDAVPVSPAPHPAHDTRRVSLVSSSLTPVGEVERYEEQQQEPQQHLKHDQEQQQEPQQQPEHDQEQQQKPQQQPEHDQEQQHQAPHGSQLTLEEGDVEANNFENDNPTNEQSEQVNADDVVVKPDAEVKTENRSDNHNMAENNNTVTNNNTVENNNTDDTNTEWGAADWGDASTDELCKKGLPPLAKSSAAGSAEPSPNKGPARLPPIMSNNDVRSTGSTRMESQPPPKRGTEHAFRLSDQQRSDGDDGGIGCCGYVLWALSMLLIVVTFPFSLCACIKVVQEYERAVIFRLGRLLSGGAKGPGLFFIVPCMDAYTKVDLRTVSFDVPPQEVLTRDSVTVAVDAVVYYRVNNATMCITNVEDASRSTRLLAATTLRNVLGTKNLSEILSDREHISQTMQLSLDEATDPWGIKVERVEVKDVRLPVQLQRAMAAEAEASREARAKVIAAEGEQKASRALKEAADVMIQSPAALQLRYLQTLNTISAEKNSTIIFPLPIDMLAGFMK